MTNDGKQDLSRTTSLPPVQPNELDGSDKFADVALIEFMASLGFEYHPNKYYCCFTKDEGTCELTVYGARQLMAAIEKDRLLWLKSIVPKKQADGGPISRVAGWNAYHDQLMKNAEEKQ